MGYYSDVRFNVRKEDFKKLQKASADIFSKDVDLMKAENLDEYKELKDEAIIFGWNGIKWYESSFPEIDFIRKFLDENSMEYEFVRVGEDREDIEYYEHLSWNGSLEGHIEPVTYINVY